MELFEFTVIASDDTARTILENISKIFDIRQKKVMITNHTMDATSLDYFMDLE